MDTFFSSLRIHNIRLGVLNLEMSARFYRDVIGLKEIGRDGQVVRFSANGSDPPLIVLEGDSAAFPRPVTAPGLFHTALLFPDRLELARTMRHVGEKGWKFQGFADHGVSEALYLADAEGNGIELYRDRPRSEWPVGSDGIAMVSDPLDVAGLMSELDGVSSSYAGVHQDVVVGHMHLQVSNLERARTFYHEFIGLDITQRSYPGALFLSADGYHHHIGLNIWNSRGSQPAAEHATGLKSFELGTSPARLGLIADRIRTLGRGDGLDRKDAQKHRLVDPDGIFIDLSVSNKDAVSVRHS
ncbi:MAG: VOC family protein [Bacteroidota bacterium]